MYKFDVRFDLNMNFDFSNSQHLKKMKVTRPFPQMGTVEILLTIIHIFFAFFGRNHENIQIFDITRCVYAYLILSTISRHLAQGISKLET